MGGGSSGGGRGGWVPLDSLIEDRHVHRNWLLECHDKGIRSDVVEAYVMGNSYRQIAQQFGMRRTTAADIVERGLDLYADMRGYRVQSPRAARIQVWEAPACLVMDSETPVHTLPIKAALRNRNIRN